MRSIYCCQRSENLNFFAYCKDYRWVGSRACLKALRTRKIPQPHGNRTTSPRLSSPWAKPVRLSDYCTRKKWTIMTVGNQYRSQGSLKMWKRNASTTVSRARWSSSVTDKLNSSHFVAPDPRDTARSRIPYIWKQYRPPEPDGESKSTFGKVSRALVLRLWCSCWDGQTLVPSLFKQHYLIRTRYIW